MNILITGANGFLGRNLVYALLNKKYLNWQKITRIIIFDQTLEDFPDDPLLLPIQGDITDSRVIKKIFDYPIATIFHLISLAGGAAQEMPLKGLRINLIASLSLFDIAAAQSIRPTLIYSSSIAVYSEIGEKIFQEERNPNPVSSYGKHKWLCEVALQDLHQQKLLSARIIRFPGLVARPEFSVALKSAFMSNIITCMAKGIPWTCPVSVAATSWWMSVSCAVDNLIIAAELPHSDETAKAWLLPALSLSVGQVVDYLATMYPKNKGIIIFDPDPTLERDFGHLPPIHTPCAIKIGFRSDDNIANLISNALSTK